MSATLRSAVRKTLAGGDATAGAVADVLPIAPETGTVARGVVLPVGHGPERAAVALAAGRYLVQAHLPSGDVVSQQISVKEGEVAEVVLQAEGSRHEWLGWSHLVSPTARWMGKSRRPAPPSSVPTLILIETPAAATPAPAQGPWRALAALADSRAGVDVPACADALGGHPFGPPLLPRSDDGASRLFDLPGTLNTYSRWYALVRRGDRADLVALALPWRIYSRQDWILGDASVDVVIEGEGSGSIDVTVKDPERGALLGYLANGALPSARSMLEPGTAAGQMALDGLFGKAANPYAAAASACVLLQTSPGEEQRWHPWIENLAGRFEWLPDGAVLLATDRLARARTAADVAGAREIFEEAVRRGLPVFTSVLRLLLDGMTTLVADPDTDAGSLEDTLPLVRAVARRADMHVPFTTIRLGGRP